MYLYFKHCEFSEHLQREPLKILLTDTNVISRPEYSILQTNALFIEFTQAYKHKRIHKI